MKYFGDFGSHEDVEREFSNERFYNKEQGFKPIEGFPSDDEILIADYSQEMYEGSAFVLFERDGKLYEVNAGHCSCYGLEGQWVPEETTWAALGLRRLTEYSNVRTPEAREAFARLVAEHAT